MSNILKIAFLSTLFVLFLPINSMQQQSSQQSALGKPSFLLAAAGIGVLSIGAGIYYFSANQKALKQKAATEELLTGLNQGFGDREKAIKAILDGADVNVKMPLLMTPLHHAVDGDDIELAKLLLDKNADITAEDYLKHDPIKHAVYNGSRWENRMLKLLLTHRPINNTYGNSLLHFSVCYHNINAINFFLENGAPIHMRIPYTQGTLLHSCARSEHSWISANAPITRLFLERGINFDLKETYDGSEKGTAEDLAKMLYNSPVFDAIQDKRKQIQQKNITQFAHATYDTCPLDEIGLGTYVAEYAAPELKECSFALSQKLNGSALQYP